MEKAKCPIIFNTKTKVWTNISSIDENVKVLGLGEIILKQLDSYDAEKVIEINIDTGIKTTALEMKLLTINFALNLQNMGIKQGDVVVLFCSMNPLTTPLIYACLIIGAIFVPLETLYTNDVIEYIFELVNPTIIAYSSDHYDQLTKIIAGLQLPNFKYFLSFESQENENSIRQKLYKPQNSDEIVENFQPPKLGNPQDVYGAFVLTSGTTGRPKLMAHSHSYLGLGATTYWPVDNTDTVYVASPIRWISQISAILQPILQHCIRVYATLPPSPKNCAEAIQKYKVTHFFSVSTFMKQVLEYVYKEQGKHFESLKAILTGGERIPTKILNIIQNLNSNCTVIQCYGMTELGGCIGNDIGTNMKGGYYLVPGLQCRIMDEDGKLLMENENGIICVKGQVKLGTYWKSESSQSSFTEDGWLITGDYGKIDENNQLHVYNRFKDLIKSDGKIIIPSLIESILDAHPLVDAGYIVGVPHQDKTKGEFSVAFCKLNDTKLRKLNLSEEQAKEDIMKFLNLSLSEDQISPLQIFLRNEFPFTSCGKVDKLNLRSMAIEKIIL